MRWNRTSKVIVDVGRLRNPSSTATPPPEVGHFVAQDMLRSMGHRTSDTLELGLCKGVLSRLQVSEWQWSYSRTVDIICASRNPTQLIVAGVGAKSQYIDVEPDHIKLLNSTDRDLTRLERLVEVQHDKIVESTQQYNLPFQPNTRILRVISQIYTQPSTAFSPPFFPSASSQAFSFSWRHNSRKNTRMPQATFNLPQALNFPPCLMFAPYRQGE